MTSDEIIRRLARILHLDENAFIEVRDDARWTPVCVAVLVASVFLAAIGAWLYGHTVLSTTPDRWLVDTVILGTIITTLLFFAGVGVIYVLVTQGFRYNIAPDALLRVVTVSHLPFALSFLVFIPKLGFGFGMLSFMALFFYTVYGLRSTIMGANTFNLMIAVFAGFAVWAMVVPLVTDPGNDFFSGAFVYSLIA